MTGILTDVLHSITHVVPRLLAFVVILAVGYLVGRLLFKAVDRGLQRVGFDRAVERSAAHQALARANLDASDLLARLVYYAVLLFTLQLAFRVWGPNPVSDLLASVLTWLPRAAVAIVIVVVASAIARRVRDLIATALAGLSYGRPLATITSGAIMGIGIIAALNQVGVATTVTTPILVTILATAGGIAVVGLGGGLVRPMQQRWERWLGQVDQESAVISERARAYAAGRSDTQANTQQANTRQATAEQAPDTANSELIADEMTTADLAMPAYAAAGRTYRSAASSTGNGPDATSQTTELPRWSTAGGPADMDGTEGRYGE